ncbi:MAG TPA: DUF1611 domain-containing protein [Thermoanaerobaculia bacterium]|jgi:uncharacterized NAD-dependent epimerase/dehydratase family protein|nr:DUF1611 domain-containing protein [Thermoanaerobaculia bacterium]
MDGTAIIVCDDLYSTANAKTAHGLVRGTDRYRVLAVIDGPVAGRDAGEILDGVRRGIPVFATIADAVRALPEKPEFCVVGVATSGGRVTPGLRALLTEAIEAGLSVVNGLHEFLSDDPTAVAAAERKGVTIRDVRKTPPRSQLHFWSGEILTVPAPRIAVLGTDCALGKRTTARFLLEACRAAGIPTELVYTGQTGWMQGAPYGFVLDSVPNDFVSGELEHAIVSCWKAARPELILLEGQSALRNPSGPCGSEFILSGRAAGVILQHAPHRAWYEGLEEFNLRVPPVADEIELIHRLGARTLAVTLNGEGMRPEALRAEQQRLRWGLGIPVVLPLEEGVGALVPVVREFLAAEATG